MKKMFAFALVALMAMPLVASAQTMAVSAVEGTGFVQAFTLPAGAPFSIVVWGDTAGNDSSAAEFVVTELLQIYPGILKTGTVKINNTTLDLGDNSLGEYLLAFGACFPPSSQLEMVRVNYFDFSGVVGGDVVMTLRGFQPGDTRPSSFNGQPGFVDCQQVKYAATMGGVDGGYTGAQVTFPDGGLVLNPTPSVVPNEAGSFGELKARF